MNINHAMPVRPKDRIAFQCRQCGNCCRHIEGCVMVESLDAYHIAKFLREQDQSIQTPDDILTRYCSIEPITERGYPIYVLQATGSDSACVFLKEGRCSIYEARPRTCRIYPLSVGPGQRGKDFEYVACLDVHQAHFSGRQVMVKDWLTQNFTREYKEFLKREFQIVPEIGRKLGAVPPQLLPHALFLFLCYRYSNFDLDQPFWPQYEQNNAELLRQLSLLLRDGTGDE